MFNDEFINIFLELLLDSAINEDDPLKRRELVSIGNKLTIILKEENKISHDEKLKVLKDVLFSNNKLIEKIYEKVILNCNK